MIRRIIEINEEKCNGCGLCAEACHEGAIGMVNGKARPVRSETITVTAWETAFLPVRQTRSASWNGKPLHTMPRRGARAHQKHKNTAPLPCGRPGTQARELRPHTAAKASAPSPAPTESQLRLSGRYRSNSSRYKRPILKMQSCSSPPTAPRTPMPGLSSGLHEGQNHPHGLSQTRQHRLYGKN